MITGDARTDAAIERFRRGIKDWRVDREVFDRMIDSAGANAGANVELAPMERLVLSVLLARERELANLKK
jgi:hypothetical protein